MVPWGLNFLLYLLINERVMAARGQWLHVERWVCPSDHPTS